MSILTGLNETEVMEPCFVNIVHARYSMKSNIQLFNERCEQLDRREKVNKLTVLQHSPLP